MVQSAAAGSLCPLTSYTVQHRGPYKLTSKDSEVTKKDISAAQLGVVDIVL